MAREEKMEKGEVYKGPCGILKDSLWLTAETLPADRDTIVTIEAVIRRKAVKFGNETKHNYGSLRFVGKDRELGLNSTHIKVLKALFGPNTGDWFGKRVALYVDPAVSAFGQIVSAVRIRAKHITDAQPSKSAKPEADLPPLTEDEMRAADRALDEEGGA